MIWHNPVSFSLIFSPSISKYKILCIIHLFLLQTTIPQFPTAIFPSNHKEFNNRIHPENQKSPLKCDKLHHILKGS